MIREVGRSQGVSSLGTLVPAIPKAGTVAKVVVVALLFLGAARLIYSIYKGLSHWFFSTNTNNQIDQKQNATNPSASDEPQNISTSVPNPTKENQEPTDSTLTSTSDARTAVEPTPQQVPAATSTPSAPPASVSDDHQADNQPTELQTDALASAAELEVEAPGAQAASAQGSTEQPAEVDAQPAPQHAGASAAENHQVLGVAEIQAYVGPQIGLQSKEYRGAIADAITDKMMKNLEEEITIILANYPKKRK